VKLVNAAAGRPLLSFHSTYDWGIGNHMFAFASTLAIGSDTESGGSDFLTCFDEASPLRDAFPALSNWPACRPNDVLGLLNTELRKEAAYARSMTMFIRQEFTRFIR